MQAFLAEQADFILFFYGLAFILLGLTSFATSRYASIVQSWAVLGWFGLVHGASEWLDLCGLVIGNASVFAALSTATTAASYVLLLEFVRRELKQLGYWVPGAWIYGVLLLIVAVGGATRGLTEANAIARYTMGPAGAWGAAFVFARYARRLPGSARQFAIMAAAAFGLYGIAAGVIVSPAIVWPEEAFNRQWFFDAAGVPLQLVRGVLACCIAVAIWGIWGQKVISEVSSTRYTRYLRQQFVVTVAIMAAILFFGWGLTEYFGIVHKQHLKEQTRGDLDLLASGLTGLTAPLDAVVKSLAGSPTVRAALSGDARASDEVASVLSLDVAASGAQKGFILDEMGAIVASSGHAPDAATTRREDTPYLQGSMSEEAGHHFYFDAAAKETLYASSYPVRQASGDAIGVAVLMLALGGFETTLEAFDRPVFLVDPQGIIALANRPDMLGRVVWASPAATFADPSKAPPMQAATSLSEKAVTEGSWATVNGKPMYVRRCSLTNTDWSLVIFVPLEGIFASRVLGIAITLLITVMVLIYIIARERAVHDHVQMDRRLELEELARILDHRATTDTLTGLSNRLKFDEALAMEIRRARRFETPLSLILYDVDHFKSINDNHGHQVGDAVLTTLSRFVSQRMRATDLLARWGGEEFAILVAHADGNMAASFAGILRASIARFEFDGVGALTCSFGVAELVRGESADSLVARADEALYRAKLAGRNRVEQALWSPVDDEGVGSAA
jgi:diguanylate cyclase (GGDEF)-like protein